MKTPIRISAPRALWVTLTVCLTLLGCVDPSETETLQFERAEDAYRRGSYSEAIDGYEKFLGRYPKSPLAEVAKLRKRCINREVQSLLKRADTPRPVYRASAQSSTRE